MVKKSRDTLSKPWMWEEKEKKPRGRKPEHLGRRKFNGRWYERTIKDWKIKEEAKKEQKYLRSNGYNAIIDKDKDGYFLWFNTKRIKSV